MEEISFRFSNLDSLKRSKFCAGFSLINHQNKGQMDDPLAFWKYLANLEKDPFLVDIKGY